jgi:phage-related protein
MPENIPAADLQRARELQSSDPWIWLYEIEVPTTPPTRYRLTPHTSAVQFGTDSAGAALTYSPFPISHREMKVSSEGDLPQVSLVVANVTREIQAVLEAHDGLVGQPVKIILANKGTLASATPTLEEDFEITGVRATDDSIVATLGQHNLWRSLFPGDRILRDHCRFQYKGARCGYTGGITACDKSLNGANGCVVHANQDRFGGFPSIPRAGSI